MHAWGVEFSLKHYSAPPFLASHKIAQQTPLTLPGVPTAHGFGDLRTRKHSDIRNSSSISLGPFF